MTERKTLIERLLEDEDTQAPFATLLDSVGEQKTWEMFKQAGALYEEFLGILNGHHDIDSDISRILSSWILAAHALHIWERAVQIGRDVRDIAESMDEGEAEAATGVFAETQQDEDEEVPARLQADIIMLSVIQHARDIMQETLNGRA